MNSSSIYVDSEQKKKRGGGANKRQKLHQRQTDSLRRLSVCGSAVWHAVTQAISSPPCGDGEISVVKYNSQYQYNITRMKETNHFGARYNHPFPKPHRLCRFSASRRVASSCVVVAVVIQHRSGRRVMVVVRVAQILDGGWWWDANRAVSISTTSSFPPTSTSFSSAAALVNLRLGFPRPYWSGSYSGSPLREFRRGLEGISGCEVPCMVSPWPPCRSTRHVRPRYGTTANDCAPAQ